MTHPMGPTSTGWLAERRPGRCATTVDFCRRHGLVLVRISSTPQTGTPAPPDAGQHAGWIDLHLAGDALPAGIQARVADLAVPVIAGERVSPGHCRRQFHRSLDTLSRRYRLIGVAEVRQAEDVLDGARQRVPLADGGPDKVEEVGKGSPCSRSGTGSG